MQACSWQTIKGRILSRDRNLGRQVGQHRPLYKEALEPGEGPAALE